MQPHIHDWNAFHAISEDSDEYARLLQHLDSCETCRQTLDTKFDSAAQELLSSSTSGDQSQDSLGRLLSEMQDEDWYPELSRLAVTVDMAIKPSSHSETELECTFESEYQTDTGEIHGLEPAVHPELLGRIGRYNVERVIGRGGMGVVFRAHDSELHRVVAIKTLAEHLNSSGAARQRFVREARAAAAVLHPNVLRIHDINASHTTPYIVMHYVEGESLQARVDRHGPLAVTDALRIAKQTAEALSAAHSQGLIHRDVKPANILLEEGTDHAILGDFGLARTSDDASLTRTGIVAGTPHYMSPEQAHGQDITSSSDLFALGSVLYFMLTGRPPFRAESAMGVLNNVCTKKHTPLRAVNASVPQELSQLVDQLLNKKPSRRLPSAEAVSKRLEQLLSAWQSGQLRLGPSESFRRNLGLAVLALAASVAVFAPRTWWSGYQTSPSEGSASITLDDASNSTDFVTLDSTSPASTSPASPVDAPESTPAHTLPDQSAWDSEVHRARTLILGVENQSKNQGQLDALFRDQGLWQQELSQLDAKLRELEQSLELSNF